MSDAQMSVQITLPLLELLVWCLVTISRVVGHDHPLMPPLALLSAILMVIFSKNYNLCELKWELCINTRM